MWFLPATNVWFQAAVTVAAAWAAVMVWRGAFLGLRGHRPARVALAATSTLFVGVYAAQLFGWVSYVDAGQILRGFSLVLWLAIGWTAHTGLKYWRRAAVEHADAVELAAQIGRDE